ncbi:MAG: rane-associated phospholipid phosphatase [Mycobacterium sp.]|nr:rane-associated phospholipid phosphatase [Mycobacterium sp.]
MISDPDPRWFPLINEFARDTPWLHPIMIGYADYGIVVFAALLLAGWWMARHSGDLNLMAAATWAPLGVLAAVAINQPVVAALHVAHPYVALPDIVVLAHRGTDGSFPSDYAVLVGALAAGLWWVDRKLGTVAVIAAAAMAFTRVYIAAEYIRDVLAGLTLGIAIGGAGFWAAGPGLHWLLTRAEQSRLVRPLLTAAHLIERASR